MCLSNLFLLNWGSQAVPSGNVNPSPSTFALAYDTACFQVVTNLVLNGGNGIKIVGAEVLSLTSIIWRERYTNYAEREGFIRWLALGC